jgi:Protein of unknown function (DUF1579)
MRQALAVVLLMLTFGTLIVQSQERRTSEMEGTNPTQPGKYHKLLGVLAGSWDVTVKFKYGSGPERENKANSEAKWVLGGRFLEQEYTADLGGMPLFITQYVGYDNQRKKFFEIKFDNMDTGVLHTEGAISDDEKVITNVGERTDPMTGKSGRLRTVTTITDKDHYTVEWFLTGTDGKEQKTVTLIHTRKK